MSVIKVIELVASSEKSWEDAVQQAIAEASQSLRHIRGVDVIKHTAHVEHGKITEYRATLHVAFLVEHHSQLIGGGPAKK
jgi:flavin-binding protein dodecin